MLIQGPKGGLEIRKRIKLFAESGTKILPQKFVISVLLMFCSSFFRGQLLTAEFHAQTT